MYTLSIVHKIEEILALLLSCSEDDCICPSQLVEFNQAVRLLRLLSDELQEPAEVAD